MIPETNAFCVWMISNISELVEAKARTINFKNEERYFKLSAVVRYESCFWQKGTD